MLKLASLRNILALACAAGAALMAMPASSASGGNNGRLQINGVDYYYEVHGKGEPLLLLTAGWARSTCSVRCCRSSPKRAK